MKDFDYWKRQHETENLEEFSSDAQGFLWLKVKSIVRKEFIAEFSAAIGIALKEKSLQGQFRELYDLLADDPAGSNISGRKTRRFWKD